MDEKGARVCFKFEQRFDFKDGFFPRQLDEELGQAKLVHAREMSVLEAKLKENAAMVSVDRIRGLNQRYEQTFLSTCNTSVL